MEVKVTIALDDRTHEILNRLVDVLSCKPTHETAATPKAQSAPQKAPESDGEWTKEEIEEVLAAEADRAADGEPDGKTAPVKQSPAITIEGLRALAADVKEKQGSVASVKKLLTEYGAKNVSSLPESVWDEFAAKLKGLL